jgi:hypothetical protein
MAKAHIWPGELKTEKFTGLKFYWSWAGGLVLIVRTDFIDDRTCNIHR